MEDKKVLRLLALEMEARIAAQTVVLTQTKLIMLNIAAICSKISERGEAETKR